MKNIDKNKMTENLTENLPHALDNIERIFKLLEKQLPALFLDFDGTLSPIVSKAEDAILPVKNKEAIISLAKRIPIALISGRDREDVKSKVQLDNLIYAGSHGFDITGPNGLEMQYEPGLKILPVLDQAQKNLQEKLKNIKGANVERKKYAIAVHFRNVEEDKVKDVERTVLEELDHHETLKKGSGKKIIELKPNLDWHKGRALSWLMENLEFTKKNYLPIFIGDDITDEDALEAIRENGIGILVGTHDQATAASFRLNDTDEVTLFLEELDRWLTARNN